MARAKFWACGGRPVPRRMLDRVRRRFPTARPYERAEGISSNFARCDQKIRRPAPFGRKSSPFWRAAVPYQFSLIPSRSRNPAHGAQSRKRRVGQ